MSGSLRDAACGLKRSLPFLLLSVTLCVAQAQAAAAPALWLVQGPKAKVFLFGTIHIMKSGAGWSTPAIDQALSQSDDLWLETADDPLDATAVLPQIKSLGLDAEHPLSTKITKDDVARLDAVAKAMGLSGEAVFEPMRPWFVGLMVGLSPASKAGYSGSRGIDEVLRAKMAAAGKLVKGFETINEQLHFFADLTQAQEVAFLHEALAVPAVRSSSSAGFDAMAALWRSGDVERVAALEAQINSNDPQLVQVLVVKRNATWATLLDRRLQGEGTSFVAVGMLHLAGAGSLIDDLTKLGYTVTRVE